MDKFTVSLPKISLDEAQLQAAKVGLTLDSFIHRAVNSYIMDLKVHEEIERYSEMRDQDKKAYLYKLLEELRENGIATDDDEKRLDKVIERGDYKDYYTFFLDFWLKDKYELVYPVHISAYK